MPSTQSELSSLWASFNIDALAKPTAFSSLSVPIHGSSVSLDKPSYIKILFPVLKKISIFILTFSLFVFWYWFFSVQYPVETQQIFGDTIWFVNRTISLVDNNVSSTNTSEPETNIVDEKIHSVADISQDIDTPLTNAIVDAQSISTSETNAVESVLEIADPSSTTNINVPESSDVILSGSSDTISQDIPLTDRTLLSLRTDLADIQKKADLYLVQVSGAPVSYKMSIARAISTKATNLSSNSSSLSLDELTKEIDILNWLIERLK